MKEYINLFHSMLSDIHYWDTSEKSKKIKNFESFLSDYADIGALIEYFDDFNNNLSKNTLNYF